jgi:hypothetical protein
MFFRGLRTAEPVVIFVTPEDTPILMLCKCYAISGLAFFAS